MAIKRRKPSSGIQPPDLPRRAVPDDLPAPLADNGAYVDLVLSNADFAGQTADNVLFDRVHFKRPLFSAAQLQSAELVDVRFDSSDLSRVEWEKPRFKRVELVGSRIMGLKLLDASVEETVFKDCNAEFALFWSSTFSAVRFENCILRAASFVGSNLNGVAFDKCDLRDAGFQGASLVGADLSGAQIEGLKIGAKELQGAVIDPGQAVHVVSVLGITVKWE